ncbi:hypothetical protein, partial [Escherichia coli]|uniref:hypothetical protein n=1 Tax=Escherichia coli TaxID=562 RepID=UPI003B9FDE62
SLPPRASWRARSASVTCGMAGIASAVTSLGGASPRTWYTRWPTYASRQLPAGTRTGSAL